MADQKPSKLDKALELKAKYEALIQEAKEESLAAINEQIAELKKLGFHYQVVEAGQAPKAAAKTALPRAKDSTKVCEICKFLTDPNHDGRKHRSQGEHKKPFTEAELTSLGLKKA